MTYNISKAIILILNIRKISKKKVKVKTYKIIILLLVCACQTWSLTLREEHRLRVFENRVLRRIFGPKRDEVTGDWSKLHNEKLKNCILRQILLL
jgi:uncharacterized membrane protein